MAVTVGPDQRSSKKHIFAAGDVCGPYEIVHVAIQQAEVAARNAARQLGKLGGSPEETDYRLKLFALFTDPQMALVGLTEKEARKAGRDRLRRGDAPLRRPREVDGARRDRRLRQAHRPPRHRARFIGGAVVGPEAAELIHEIVVAMHFRATAAALASRAALPPDAQRNLDVPGGGIGGQMMQNGERQKMRNAECGSPEDRRK